MQPEQATPCFGMHDLFDSTDSRDHWAARAICQECPVILQCAAETAAVKKAGGLFGQPVGTWAGELYRERGLPRRDRAEYQRTYAKRVEIEDAQYTNDQARTASNAFKKGERNDWTRTGHRVWQRRQKRAQREKGVA